MLLKKMCKYPKRFALFAIALFISSSTALAVTIPASSCGPRQSLIDAGKSPDLLYALKHADCKRPLLSTEYRTAPDTKWCLADDAKPDHTKTMAALRGEMDQFGPAPKGSCVSKSAPGGPAAGSAGCEDAKAALAKANDTIKGLRDELLKKQSNKDQFNKLWVDAELYETASKELAAAKKSLEDAQDKLKNATAGMIPWWWLFIPFLCMLALLLLLWRHKDSQVKAAKESARSDSDDLGKTIESLNNELSRVRTANAELVEERDAYKKCMEQCRADLMNTRIEMGEEMDALTARVSQLEHALKVAEVPIPAAELPTVHMAVPPVAGPIAETLPLPKPPQQ